MHKVIGKYTRVKGQVDSYKPSATRSYKGWEAKTNTKPSMRDIVTYWSYGRSDSAHTYKYIMRYDRKRPGYESRGLKKELA